MTPVFGLAAERLAARHFGFALCHAIRRASGGTAARAHRDLAGSGRSSLGEEAKWQAFATARAALAASGTVTLELGIAATPMVVAYKVSAVEAALIRRLVTLATPVLPDIIMGTTVIPCCCRKLARPKPWPRLCLR